MTGINLLRNRYRKPTKKLLKLTFKQKYSLNYFQFDFSELVFLSTAVFRIPNACIFHIPQYYDLVLVRTIKQLP